MSAVRMLNPDADILKSGQATMMNINAAKGLADVLKTNLGPKGTLKMLVSGALDIKLTKDGSVLLGEMQIQHPTAAMIARTAGAQDEITGDGTTTNVVFTGELMKQSERYLNDGIHPRVLTEGFELARVKALEVLDEVKVTHNMDRELLVQVARSVMKTKLQSEIVDKLAEDVVDAVLAIKPDEPSTPIDLHMIELMHMKHRSSSECRLVRGLVMDHGARHPDMPKSLQDCFILTLNVSLEYEKTEVNSSVFYSSAEHRAKMVEAERKFTDDKVRQIIDFKRSVCEGENKNKGFVIINQKGIDPLSLDMLAKDGIFALRRAKRRNMERLVLSCGGSQANSSDDLSMDCLGYAGSVHEHVLGEDKYTFVEDCRNPRSVTLLIKGPNDHTISLIKQAIHDGIRAVKNTIEDGVVVPGAGAYELKCAEVLKEYMKTVSGKTKLGIQVFADSILCVPKTLAENSGLDSQDVLIRLQEETQGGMLVGLDIETGEPMDPVVEGVWDGYRSKRQLLHSSTMNATQLLLVDEIIRAGKTIHKPGPSGH